MIIKQLLSNLAILTSLLFLYTQLTKSSPLQRSSTISRKLLMGSTGGLLSNVLMQYSMQFESTIVDLRHIPVILLAYYGGAVPALIAMLFVIIGRLMIGINLSAYAGVILIVLITLISIYLSNKNLSKKVKIIYILTLSNIIFSVLVSIILTDAHILMFLIPSYWGISYLGGFIGFYMVEYLRNSQELFDRYKSESSTDGLTGLNNVRKFDELFNSFLSTIEQKQEKLSLQYIDIDHFKRINDTYGHKEGDVVLRELGNILKNSVRSFDIVSRNGGEEFTIILLDCSLERAKEISESIRERVEKYNFTLNSGENISITVSIGVACYNDTTMNSASLIEDADKALYQAKRTGRNKVCVSNS